MRFRKILQRGVLILVLLIVTTMSLPNLNQDTPTTQAEAPEDAVPLETCVLTPEILGGQGYSLTGMGFSLTGMGFSLTGMGFSLTGMGFSLTGMGLDPIEIAEEIRDNPISAEWLTNLEPDIANGEGFGTEPTAVLIIDDFSSEEAHGTVLLQIFEELSAEIDTSNILLVPIDVSGTDVAYQADVIGTKLQHTIEGGSMGEYGETGLIGQGYQHFVVNLSFGLIPCSSDAVEIRGVPLPAFNFAEALAAINEANSPQPPQPVQPVLECVMDNGNGNYTAYFGYNNENDYSVPISVSHDNRFIGGRRNRGQPVVFEAGRQINAFTVDFRRHNTLRWRLEGPDGTRQTAVANRHSTPCDFTPTEPTEPIVPILECVGDNGDGQYIAHFGYENFNEQAVTIKTGNKNRFSPGRKDQGQTITFLPGRHEKVFSVPFNGSELTWKLKGPDGQRLTATATLSDPPCVEPVGYGLIDYLKEELGIPDEFIEDYLEYLMDSVDEEADLGGLRELMQGYLEESATSDSEFALIPVAAAGNYRPWLTSAPLTPARWPEMIAVSGTLGNYGPQWRFAHDGNLIAPAAGYPLGNNTYVAGTSVSAAFVSMASAMWLTYPDACIFDGVNPPLTVAALAKDVNQPFTPGGISPLTCYNTPNLTLDNPGDQVNVEGDDVELLMEAHNGENLSFTATGLPAGLAIDETSGLISGTIVDGAAGEYVVMVEVGNDTANASVEFTWTVADSSQLGVCYASDMVYYNPGTRKNGSPIHPHRDDPTAALGEPQRVDTMNFVALGFGDQQNTGVLVLAFDAPILNQNGNQTDFRVWETSFSDANRAWSRYPEAVRIEVSKDGNTWVTVGYTTDKDQAYDLGPLDWAKYVKLVDITEPNHPRFHGWADGFDVDGIEGFACNLDEANDDVPVASGWIESDDPTVQRDGTWTSANADAASGGSYVYNTGAEEDVLTLHFEGSYVEISYLRHPFLGTFTVIVDDVAIRSVMSFGFITSFDNRVVIDYLEPGSHTLQIVSGIGVTAIDAFYVPEVNPGE